MRCDRRILSRSYRLRCDHRILHLSVSILAGMASGPRPKRARTASEALVEVHRGPYISQTALSHVLTYIRDNGLPETISRRSQYRAYEKHVVNDHNAYGHILKGMKMPVGDDGDGRTFENWVCNPGALLYAMCKNSGPFRSVMRRQLQKHPCSLSEP